MNGIPRQGCNVFYGSYVDNYNNGTRTRYYKTGGRWISSSTATATRPTGAICMEEVELAEGSEIAGVVNLGAICLGVILVLLGVKMVLGRLLR